jgi:dipeptidyl aminopeptidase/acylaminoacyl peptidase
MKLFKSKLSVFTLSSVILVFSILLFNYFSANRNNKSVVKEIVKNDTQEVTATLGPTPSPFPFQEMTIPYLRQRPYNSKLQDLNKLEENENYTAYLTSYTSDNLNIKGLLTIPKGQKPKNGWPAIVFVHGYVPPQDYKTTEKYVAYVDYLAKSGFVVFKTDLRGHGSSEGQPIGAYYSSDYVVDTLNAYNALQKVNFIDKNKIGLWGHSMGGNIVFRSMVVKENIPAVVIWAGAVYTYSDMNNFRISDKSYQPPDPNSYDQQYRKQLYDSYGSFNPNNKFWKQIIPTNYLEGVTSALQINHAEDDSVVPISFSENVMKILDNTSLVHEFNKYPEGGHNISEPGFTQAMENTVGFFKKYLK